MRVAGVFLSCLLGCGMALAQSSSGGTVNQMSVDPEQNQKMTGSMGTETGQPNDVNRGADHNQQLGNPSNRQISGQQGSRASKSKQAPGGATSANQNSASTNSTARTRREDQRDDSAQQTGAKSKSATPQSSTTPH